MRRALIATLGIVKVLLMVVLGIPPLASRHKVGDNLALPPLLVGLMGDLLGDALLLVVVVEDTGAVLRARVWALLVMGGWVMHAVEVLDEVGVGNFLGVVGELDGFGVTTTTRADLAVTWALGVSSDIANASVVETLADKGLAEHVLNTPEAASGESSLVAPLWNVDGAGGAGWTKRHARGEGEWAHKLCDERWHGCGEHDEIEFEGLRWRQG